MAGWHIVDGKAKKCTAVFRSCPYQDYPTEEYANAVINSRVMYPEWMKKGADLRKRIEAKDYPFMSLNHDDGGMGIQNVISAASRFTKMMGEKPLTHQAVYAFEGITVLREPDISEKNELVNRWTLLGSSRIELDFDNDYTNSVQRLYGKVSFNSKGVKGYDSSMRANNASRNIAALVNAIDEREKGPWTVSKKHWDRDTTFKKSVRGNDVVVDQMLQTSNYDGALLEMYADEKYDRGEQWDNTRIRIWDNFDKSRKNDGWAFRYDNGRIFFDKGQVAYDGGKVESEEMYSIDHLRAKVTNELVSMGRKKEEAEEKANYACRIVRETESYIMSDRNPSEMTPEGVRGRLSKENEHRGAIEREQNREIVAKNKSNSYRPVGQGPRFGTTMEKKKTAVERLEELLASKG